MTRNLGIADRLLRLVIGAVILGLYGAVEPPLKYLTLIGLIPLGTALTGSCPLYSLLGISTLRKHLAPPQR
jgi:Inner membrane protein YgaP-like, transmembrane domain